MVIVPQVASPKFQRSHPWALWLGYDTCFGFIGRSFTLEWPTYGLPSGRIACKVPIQLQRPDEILRPLRTFNNQPFKVSVRTSYKAATHKSVQKR